MLILKGIEKGLQRAFEFTNFQASMIDKQIIVFYQSFLLTPTGERVAVEIKSYTVEGVEFDNWMAQLGTPVIIPAIEKKLQAL